MRRFERDDPRARVAPRIITGALKDLDGSGLIVHDVHDDVTPALGGFQNMHQHRISTLGTMAVPLLDRWSQGVVAVTPFVGEGFDRFQPFEHGMMLGPVAIPTKGRK
jgi:hypothetical protein